jgi:hypothetical protein
VGTLSYYAGRARELSASEVAKVAARRAFRTARQWLHRVGPGPQDAEVLQSFGVQTPQALTEVALRPRPQAWCDVSHRERTVAALLEVEGAPERAWERAERAVARHFRLFETQVHFGQRGLVEWSLDPISGHRFPLAPATSLDLAVGGADPKYPWQLGRLEALIALGQGYWLASAPEERKRFAEEFVALTTEFLRANPAGVGVHWTCAMEVSLRAANLAQALLMFRDAPAVGEPGFMLFLLRCLAEHTCFVEANLEDKGAVPNNHLLADLTGLLTVTSLLPRLPGAGRQRNLALEGLREQLPRQVWPDGVSFEGSTSYHRLVAELSTLCVLMAGADGADVGEQVAQRTHGLLAASATWCSEQGLAPQIGDNDSGRALALTDRVSLEHGYLADLGAVLFLDEGLRKPQQAPADEVLWLFGEEGLNTWRALAPRWRPRSFSSPQGGIHVLRGGGAVVTLSAGPQGERGAGSHSHNDKLSFELHLDGLPLIVDPGSPTYVRDPAERNAHRSTSAHNCLEVDGQEQVPFDPNRLFTLPEGTRAAVSAFESGDECDKVVAAHEGYLRLRQPVRVQRALELQKAARALVVEDVLEGLGVRSLRMNLQLADTEVRLRGPRGQERLRAMPLMHGAIADETLAIELGPREAPRAVILLEAGWEVALEESSWSPGYGERVLAVRLAMRMKRELPARLRWVVLFGEEVACA